MQIINVLDQGTQTERVAAIIKALTSDGFYLHEYGPGEYELFGPDGIHHHILPADMDYMEKHGLIERSTAN